MHSGHFANKPTRGQLTGGLVLSAIAVF